MRPDPELKRAVTSEAEMARFQRPIEASEPLKSSVPAVPPTPNVLPAVVARGTGSV